MKSHSYPKRLQRKFSLEIALRFCLEEWAEEVIGGIERDEFFVFHPDDSNAFTEEFGPDGSILLNKHATLPISLREWLPVACQRIREWNPFDEKPNKSTVAFYWSNLVQVLLSADLFAPFGPAAFCAEIVIVDERFRRPDESLESPFKFLLAHELVHSFDVLRIIAPAVMNWKTFWKVALHEGCVSDKVFGALNDTSDFVDSYRTENELAMVEQFWPSKGKMWFDAYNSAMG